MRIEANVDVCVSAGMCALIAPDVFDQDDIDGRVVLLTSATLGEDVGLIREAVSQCPSGALSLLEEE